ncbi:hypothetical protein DFP72DRAFT_1078226 [Ephemerocybe angulata]|uniref:Uncharacterized protein n=1 Tax=Ephemerocybe angulata TaxID=980116 RepID=A0A8H6HEB7_9AGAR|nr:hypothetical protein DFP72DRAFT_1078226 [Tulosesus angulatus]
MPYEMPTLPTNGLVGHVGPLVDAHGGHVDPRFAEVVATLPNVEQISNQVSPSGEIKSTSSVRPLELYCEPSSSIAGGDTTLTYWIVNWALCHFQSTQSCYKDGWSQLSSDHRVGLYPFDYEWQRSLRFIGATADQTLLAVDYEAGMLSFVTRCEGQDIPNISSLLWSTAMTPLDSISRDEYPTALNFSDDVPIFLTTDPQYEFNHTSFNNLLALPRHNAEIPLGSLITVGYTAVTFPYDSSPIPETRAFTLNVQFVLLHSYPPQSSSSA